jgi:hypothetical protein
MRKLEIGRKCSRKVRKGREGRFDIMQKARMFVKVGWEERKQRFGIMHNVEMLRLGS